MAANGYVPSLSRDELLGGANNQDNKYTPTLSRNDLLLGAGISQEQIDQDDYEYNREDTSSFGTALLNGVKGVVRAPISTVEGAINLDRGQSQRLRADYLVKNEGYSQEEADRLAAQEYPYADWSDIRNSDWLRAEENAAPSRKYFKNFALDVTQNAPQVAAQVGITAATGGVGGAAFMGSQIAGGSYESLVNEGVDPDRAMKASIANALIQTPMEQFATGKVLGKGKGTKLGNFADIVASEAGTEALQEYPEAAAHLWAKSPDKSYVEMIRDYADNIGETTKDAFYSGAIGGTFGLFGGAGNLAVNRKRGNNSSYNPDFSGGEVNYMVDSESGGRPQYAIPNEHFDIKDGANWEGVKSPEQKAIQRLIWEYNQVHPNDRITVTDGLRDPNASYGSETSFHKSGKGVDLWSEGILNDPDKRAWLVNRAKQMGFGEVLDEVSNPSEKATGAHFHFADFQGDIDNIPDAPLSQSSDYRSNKKNDYDFTQDDSRMAPIGEFRPLTDPEVVKDYIGRTVEGEPLKSRIPIRKVTEQEAALIKKLTGDDLSGYTHFVDMDSIRHSMKRHSEGKENAPDQVGLTKEDYQHIPDVILNPDSIELGSTNRRTKNKTLRYIKNIEGRVFVAEEILKNQKTLVTKTIWKKAPAENHADTSISPHHTSTPNSVDTVGTDGRTPSSNTLIVDKNIETVKPDSINSLYNMEENYSGETTSRKRINDLVHKFSAIPIRYGRLGRHAKGKNAKRTLGWHDGERGVIRVGQINDWNTLTHELGHSLDQQLNIGQSSQYPSELENWTKKKYAGKKNPYKQSQYLSEGVAEFWRQYLTNPQAAKQNFPGVFSEVDSTLKENPNIMKGLQEIQNEFGKWVNQTSMDRAKGAVSFADEKKDFSIPDLKDYFTDKSNLAYTYLVDSFRPLEQLQNEIQKKYGKKLPEHLRIFDNAALFQGWVSKAEKRIYSGVEGSPALMEIVEIVGKRRKEFSTYLTVLREENAYRIEQESKRQFEKGEIEAPIKYTYTHDIRDRQNIIKKHGSDKDFQKARYLFRRYNHSILDMLVEGGLKSQKDVDYLKNKWPDYAPLQRDFSTSDEIDSFISNLSSKGMANISDPIHKFKGSNKDIIDPLESTMNNTFLMIQKAEANKVGKSLLDLANLTKQGDLIEEVTGNANMREKVLSVWVDGTRKTFLVEPRVYEALTGMNKEGRSILASIVAKPEQLLRLSSTILEPSFAITNTLRDTTAAYLNATHGFIPIISNIDGLTSAWKKDAHYWEWMGSGGANSQMVMMDRNHSQRALDEMAGKKLTKEQMKYYATLLSELSETATRLGVYKRARKKGVSIREAALESRRSTLDFARMGIVTKSIKTAFLNAGVQGIDIVGRTVINHPTRTMKRLAPLLAVSAYLFLSQHDDERWKELQRREKDLYWNIIPGALLGDKITKERWEREFAPKIKPNMSDEEVTKILEEAGTIYRIPKPQVYSSLFINSTERLLGSIAGDDPNAFRDYAKSVFSDMTPNLLPVILKIPLEYATNYSLFRERNIVPLSLQNVSPENQYDRYTSELSKWIGSQTGVSPMQLDNSIRNMGSLFGTALSASDVVLGEKNKRPDSHWQELYGIRRVAKTPFASNQSSNDFYEELKEQARWENDFKLTGVRPEGFDERYYKLLKSQEAPMKAIVKHEKNIKDDPNLTAEQKRIKLDKTNLIKLEIAKKALKK